MDQLRIFLRQHGFMGWLITVFVGAFVFQFALYILLSIFRLVEYYSLLPEYLTLFTAKVWMRPWSIFTYAFVYPLAPSGLISFAIDAMFLWSFGWQFHQVFGGDRLRKFILLAVPFLGLVAILVSLILNVWDPMMTASAVVIFLVFAVACFIPDVPVSLFGVLPLRLIGFALFALVIEIINAGFGTAGFTIMLAALFGFLYARQIKAGNDWTEIIWDKLANPLVFFQPILKRIKTFFGKSTYKQPNNPSSFIATHKDITQEEIDKILDKISEKGYMSLSLEEREKLEQFAGRRKSDN